MSFDTLPHLHVAWTQATPSGTFIQYCLYRQLAGEAAQTRIAVITAIGTVTYDDYTVPSGVAATYNVTQVCNVSGTILESAQQTPVANTVSFRNLFIAECDAPATYYAQLHGRALDLTPNQNVIFSFVAGQQAPVAAIGSEQWHVIGCTDRLHLWNDMLTWTTLESLLTRQRTNSAIFCLRAGHSGERWFVIINPGYPKRQDQSGGYVASLQVTEVGYLEAV